jgi:hypothetical protein
VGCCRPPRQRDRAGYFDGLLPGPSTLEKLLELFRLEPSAVRLVRGTQKNGSDTYRLTDDSLDTARVRRDFADGFTVVLDGVERYVRTVAAPHTLDRSRSGRRRRDGRGSPMVFEEPSADAISRRRA